MRACILLGSFLFGLLFSLSAQSDYRPGFVITNSLDTLHGLVDYRGEIRNMKVCTFKESLEDDPQEFFPGDIYGYRYNIGKFYVSKFIDTESCTDTVFVEFLLKGISELFYYKSVGYSAYFIQTENDGLLELTTKQVKYNLGSQEFVKKDNKYLGVLSYALADCPEIKQDIARTGLTHKSLIQITRKYHDYKCSDESCIVYEKKLPVLQVELEPTIGYSLSTISFNSSDLSRADFKISSSPLVGIGMNFIVPQWNEKLTLFMNVAFNEDYYYGTLHEEYYSTSSANYYYHIYNSNLISSLAFKYSFPSGRFRPEVFAGIYVNSILNSHTRFLSERISGQEVRLTEENPDIFKPFNSGITAGGGVEYELFQSLQGFCHFSVLYGKNTQYQVLETTILSFRLSTGLTF